MSQGVCVVDRLLHAHARSLARMLPTPATGNTLAETHGCQLWEPLSLVELPL